MLSSRLRVIHAVENNHSTRLHLVKMNLGYLDNNCVLPRCYRCCNNCLSEHIENLLYQQKQQGQYYLGLISRQQES